MTTQTWREFAACADTDPNIFHVEVSQRRPPGVYSDAEKAALAYCRRCPVVAECFTWATFEEPSGGGGDDPLGV